MKKLFLIPLMACAMLFSTNSWAEEKVVDNFTDLKSAIDKATDGDVIKMANDITYTDETNASLLNIKTSITIDGQGNTLIGQASRTSSAYTTIAINNGGTQLVDVVIKNLTVRNTKKAGRPIETRGNISSLTLENVTITTSGSGNTQGLTIGGNQDTPATLNITNCTFNVSKSSYCIISFNPYYGNITNTEFNGWCSLYFKPINSSAGSAGSVVSLTKCTLNNQNLNKDAAGNTFGAIVLEDGGIEVTLEDCYADAQHNHTVAMQSLFLLSDWASITDEDNMGVKLTVKGEDSEVKGAIVDVYWDDVEYLPDVVSVNLQGGTYDGEYFDAAANELYVHATDQFGNPCTAVYVADGAGKYRLKQAFADNKGLNDDVEGEGAGQNPHTAFRVNANQTISSEVIADYALVEKGAELVVEDKLTLTNVDVTGDAKVVVNPGATVIVGKGGMMNESADNIVIETEDLQPASFLIAPEVTSNTTPAITIKMIAKAGKDGEDWYWHRFAMPVNGISEWKKYNAAGSEITVPTYLQGWDYAKNDWASCTVNEMVPFLGYTLTYDQIDGTATTGETEVTYVFKGNAVGNQDSKLQFQGKGWNFFGNSYTAYIDVKTLLSDVMSNPNIGGTVYMWDAHNQRFSDATMYDLQNNPSRLEDWETEIAPMQTFILQLRSVNEAEANIDYANAIWGNPRYGNVTAAPARRVASNDNYVKITVANEVGNTDNVKLVENADFSNAYDNGADADKYMNGGKMNFYATVAGQNLGSVATDRLEGTLLSLQTVAGTSYTLSFSHVEGTVYAIKDMQTGAVTEMTEGNTYTFTAAENATDEARFMVVTRAEAPTALDEVKNTAAAHKGIYTLMGQYLGETDIFNTLPAGIYVVDGVKVVR